MATPSEPQGASRHDALEVLKWLALVAMTVDHAGKTLAPANAPLAHLVGRLALPLFALVVAERLVMVPGVHGRYLRRLAVVGLVAQPAFMVVSRTTDANILFTLGLGVAIDAALRARQWWGLGLVAAGTFCEFGPLGVALVPALATLERWRRGSASWACGPLALGVGLVPLPAALWPTTGALLATPVARLFADLPIAIPRWRWLFYAYYPLHLGVLALVRLSMDQSG